MNWPAEITCCHSDQEITAAAKRDEGSPTASIPAEVKKDLYY